MDNTKKKRLSFFFMTADNFLLKEGILIYFLFFIVILVNTLDIFSSQANTIIVALNLLNILITIVFALLYLQKKVNSEFTLVIILYSALLNLIVSHWVHSINIPDYPAHFLRSTLIFGMILPILSIVSNKNHAVVIGMLYIFFYLGTLIVSKNPFLLENSPVIIVTSIIYYKAIYNLTHRLEKSREIQKELTNEIIQKNESLLTQTEYLGFINNTLDEQKKQIEEQTKELKQLVKTRDKFYSIISHDLKNPIGNLMNFSEVINNQIKNTEDEQLKKYVRALKKSSTQAYNLLIGLLEWTQVQTGNVKTSPEKFNISSTLLELIDFYLPMAETKKIKLIHNIENSQVIFADKNMIVTAMRNLISNAIKFTYPEGKVSIRLEKIEETIRVTISDTGIGIDPNAVTSLFNADLKIQRPGTENETGTGLGLLLCKEFIELNHGKIFVNSVPQKGSVFWFILPAN